MDNNNIRAHEKIARRSIEEERLARPVPYLSKFQKKVLKGVEAGIYDVEGGAKYKTPEASALNSLSALGLVSLRTTKEGVGGCLTEKGYLLLYENPALRFPVTDNTRWIVTTVLSGLAIVISIISLVAALLLQ